MEKTGEKYSILFDIFTNFRLVVQSHVSEIFLVVFLEKKTDIQYFVNRFFFLEKNSKR
jgi:hypothetical protein